jgi:hypothetical protein
MELTSCHPPGAKAFEAAPRFFFNLCISGVKERMRKKFDKTNVIQTYKLADCDENIVLAKSINFTG